MFSMFQRFLPNLHCARIFYANNIQELNFTSNFGHIVKEMKRANCEDLFCLERLHIFVLFKTLKIKTAGVSSPKYDDLL